VPISPLDISLRLGLAFAAGAIIGLERSSRRQVAGLRTHILICLGAALLMLLSIWLPQQYGGGDPGRIAAQVVSGIGFLGAGAIIRLGNNVKGLTTAASLWLIAAVGLVLGAGMYLAAAIVEALSLITLFLLDILEKRIFPAERSKLLMLSYHGSLPKQEEAETILRSFGIKVHSVDAEQSVHKSAGKSAGKGKISRLRLMASVPDSTDITKLAKALKSSGDVKRFEIKEKF
jgi:putative Mg2+ transporter-C (MgtC) family protein